MHLNARSFHEPSSYQESSSALDCEKYASSNCSRASALVAHCSSLFQDEKQTVIVMLLFLLTLFLQSTDEEHAGVGQDSANAKACGLLLGFDRLGFRLQNMDFACL